MNGALLSQIQELEFLNGDENYSILLSGDADEVKCCIDFLSVTLSQSTMERIIVATNDISEFVQYKRINLSRVIHWDESIYEEYLIDRIVSGGFAPIRIVMDFKPALRKLQRFSSIVNQESVIILKAVDLKRWQYIHPILFTLLESKKISVKECTDSYTWTRISTNCSSKTDRKICR